MLVAGVQHDIVWEDPDANFARLADLVGGAADAGARLIALTEMFATGFSMNAAAIAEDAGGPSTEFLVTQAARTGAWVAGSIPERPEPGALPANRLVVAGPDGTVHHYAKRHPFTFAGEHEHYAAGTESVTIELAGVRVSLAVCYDLRFADQFWAQAPTTDLYLVVANWPAARRSHWQALLRARAIENQAYVLGVNRVGEGDGLTYAGDTVLHDPLGATVAAAGEGEGEALVVGEVDPAQVAEVRSRFPFLQDR